jgi:hypothetical protein
MVKIIGKYILNILKIKPGKMYDLYYKRLSKWSIRMAVAENGYWDLLKKLKKIVPDISNQEEDGKEDFNDYWELKRRALQAFQCSLMLKTLEYFSSDNLTVVDIGDSAGTHMLYLKALTEGRYHIDTISVNLDSRAIEKIERRGLKALLCRAEELDLKDRHIDICTSFQMVEHLHNPAVFFHNLAEKSTCNRLVITVPYVKKSRVGLYHLRTGSEKIIFAEDEHIFELSPEDWTLLMLHSGWKVIYNRIYYQYPKKWPIISKIFASYWRSNDFEGFWGVILERYATFSNRYKDWEDS